MAKDFRPSASTGGTVVYRKKNDNQKNVKSSDKQQEKVVYVQQPPQIIYRDRVTPSSTTKAKAKIQKSFVTLDFNGYFENFWGINQQLFSGIAPILYAVCVALVYFDFLANTTSTSIASTVLTLLAKYGAMYNLVSYFAKHSTKLFGILILGFIPISSSDKPKSWLWTAVFITSAIVLKDMPIFLYVITSWAVSYYLHVGKRHKIMAALVCAVPFVYYVFFVHFLNAGDGSWQEIDANYTLPPIQFNTTAAPPSDASMNLSMPAIPIRRR